MTWTYSGNPALSDIDKYRFLVSDTDPNEPLLQDQEIQFILDSHQEENYRLYELFQKIADVLAREIKKSLGPQSEDPSGRQQYYQRRANFYRNACFSVGISKPKYSQPQSFRKGLHNNV